MDVRAGDDELRELFAHQEWVRALALRLCGDASAADDLVQDTWIEALRGRTEVRSIRAWLGGIVRHRWRRQRDRTAARTEREADSVRRPELPNPAELLEQAELQRKVLAAVASLDDASRTVVLLRYYEGLSGEDIAARIGVPGSTVRNRLARAHEKLRGALDREYGGGAWSVLFVPALAQPVSAAGSAVGVAMSTKVVAAVVLVAAGSTWWWLATRGPDSNGPLDAPAVAHDASLPNTTTSDPRATPEHVPASHNATAPAAPAAVPGPALLFGSIEGPTTEEAKEATLLAELPDGSTNELSVGANATYSAFGLPSGTIHLHTLVRGFVPKEDVIELPMSGGEVRHDVILARSFVVPVKFVDRSTGKPPKLLESPIGPRLCVVATRDRPARLENVLTRFPHRTEAGAYLAREFGGRDGVPSGFDGVLDVRVPLPVHASCVLRDTVIESRLLRGNEKELVFEFDAGQLESLLGTLRLTCVDGTTGQPLEGAKWSLGFQDGGAKQGSSDVAGLVTSTEVAPGLQKLQIIAKGFGNYDRIVRIPSGAICDLGTIELRAGATITGRVLDESGAPITARLTAVPRRQFESTRSIRSGGSAVCGPDGVFRIQNVERGPVRLIVTAEGRVVRAVDVDSSRGDLEDIRISLGIGTLVRFVPSRDTGTSTDFMLADANGMPLGMNAAGALYKRELLLEPGRYECWTFVDERVVQKEPFEVGTSPLTRVVQVP